jgi:hypothetical protein
MPTGQNPTAPGTGKPLVVEFEGNNCRATTGCDSNDFHTIIAPLKVFASDVLAGIE